MWTLRRMSDGSKYDGYYVGRSGSGESYVKRLEHAQTFSTLELATANACGNEYPVNVDDLLRDGLVRA